MVYPINMEISILNMLKVKKCERCWNYTEELGSVGELEHLCPRCQEVVKTLV